VNQAIIICQNCGTTNNELNTRICRTCGALLPVSSRSKRREKSKSKKKASTKKSSNQKVDVQIDQSNHIQNSMDLHEIPKPDDVIEIPEEPKEILDQNTESIEFNSHINEPEQFSMGPEKAGLQEITPKPFQSSILNQKQDIAHPSRSKDTVSDAFSELKQSFFEPEKKKPEPKALPTLTPIPQESQDDVATILKQKSQDDDAAILKQKRLEKDMTEVLGFLSEKISVEKLGVSEPKDVKSKKTEEKIPPASMNEILKSLAIMDSRIEASAIINRDGTILAAGISNRISESLFSTIGVNLSMIGTDIIEGLSAGVLKSISVRGSEGVMDLAPIDRESTNLKDMILILFSHPKVRSGLISLAVNNVQKQIKHYLGVEK